MTKPIFRILVVVTFIISLFGGVFDLVMPNEIVNKVTEYSESLEPEWSDTQMFLIAGMGFVGLVFILYSFIGLLLFWNSARLIYLLGYVVFIPLSIFMGIAISSGIGQAIYDIGSVLGGVILALIYFSPIEANFTQKSNNHIQPKRYPPNKMDTSP